MKCLLQNAKCIFHNKVTPCVFLVVKHLHNFPSLCGGTMEIRGSPYFPTNGKLYLLAFFLQKKFHDIELGHKTETF